MKSFWEQACYHLNLQLVQKQLFELLAILLKATVGTVTEIVIEIKLWKYATTTEKPYFLDDGAER